MRDCIQKSITKKVHDYLLENSNSKQDILNALNDIAEVLSKGGEL